MPVGALNPALDPPMPSLSLTRRRLLLGAAGLSLPFSRPAHAGDFLEDARTARSLTLRAPRITLGELLGGVAAATKVALSAAPTLAPEPLVGYVPRRALRETMAALAELFDAQWTTAGEGYRLEPEPGRARKAAEGRETYFRLLQKSLDDQAAEAVRQQRAGAPAPLGSAEQRLRFLLLVWHAFSPADRRRVLQGASVTIPIPEEPARALYPLAVALALKELRPLVGAPLATLDLDDKNDLAFPVVRARVTAMREGSIIGAIHSLDLWRRDPAAAPAAKAEGPEFPAGIGDMGRISGTRDDQILQFGEAAGVPILSRHRAQGGGGPTLLVGGRTLPQVAADLAAACEATVTAGARGFQLLRSLSEPFDPAGRLPDLTEFFKRRPARGAVVPFATLALLSPLTPYQLSVLERSNRCTAEATAARELFTVLRFYQSLSAAQKQELFTGPGLEAASLTHAQLHHFLDEKRMRGNLEIHGPLQDMRGLRFRFSEGAVEDEPAITLAVLRDGKPVEMAVSIALPEVDEEETLTVQR
jgi:hypothetical protein